MKKFLCLLAILVLMGCATYQTTPEEDVAMSAVTPVSDTKGCSFLGTRYFEVSHQSKIHHYAALNTVKAGGDSYKIMTTGSEVAFGVPIFMVNIEVYRCK